MFPNSSKAHRALGLRWPIICRWRIRHKRASKRPQQYPKLAAGAIVETRQAGSNRSTQNQRQADETTRPPPSQPNRGHKQLSQEELAAKTVNRTAVSNVCETQKLIDIWFINCFVVLSHLDPLIQSFCLYLNQFVRKPSLIKQSLHSIFFQVQSVLILNTIRL